jgi:hypothetical protein
LQMQVSHFSLLSPRPVFSATVIFTCPNFLFVRFESFNPTILGSDFKSVAGVRVRLHRTRFCI